MGKKKILVVDDEKLIVKGIRFSLEQDDMEVDCAYDGEEALAYAKQCEYDLVLLDVMLPKMDGFEVCQHIREFSDMPIVMLTAKSEDMDKILGLEYGADDYITKPFNILEVKARIKAIMRRTAKREEAQPSTVLVKGAMKIDCESRRVFIENREVNLTAKEFDVLEPVESDLGNGLSGRCKNCRCTYQKTAGEDRDESERTSVCAHEVGSWLLFPGVNYILKSKIRSRVCGFM